MADQDAVISELAELRVKIDGSTDALKEVLKGQYIRALAAASSAGVDLSSLGPEINELELEAKRKLEKEKAREDHVQVKEAELVPPSQDPAPVDWGEGGASTPTTQPVIKDWGVGEASTPTTQVIYKGPVGDIRGDAASVTSIHRTDRLFDLFETITLASLCSIVTAMTALLVMYSQPGRDTLVVLMAITGWILAIILGGFTTFRIAVSSKSIDVSAGAPSEPTKDQQRPLTETTIKAAAPAPNNA